MYGNPELLVTVGAAYWAHLCSEGATVPVAVPQPDGTVVRQDVQGGLTDITAHAVGVRVLRSDGSGGWRPANAVIVPSAAAFGKDFKKEFQTSEDGMTEIEVILYKGEDADVDRVERLMTFTIGGLPPGRAAGQRVEVTLQFDASGVLRGSAVDLATKKSCDILIERSPASSA
jgi:molecular chaperone DnaK (HSP70)